MKLKYKRRINSEIKITEDEREEIAKRIVNFMRESLRIWGSVSVSKYSGQKCKGYYFQVLGKHLYDSHWNYVYERDNYNLSDERLLSEFEYIFERFKYNIRMSASISHIKKLIEILGKKVASIILENWAKKNLAIALVLKQVVDELKEDSFEVVDEWKR